MVANSSGCSIKKLSNDGAHLTTSSFVLFSRREYNFLTKCARVTVDTSIFFLVRTTLETTVFFSFLLRIVLEVREIDRLV